MSSHSEVELQVRIAITTDRKPPRAHERSRFYMMHPEHDPREQRRQDSTLNKRGGRTRDRSASPTRGRSAYNRRDRSRSPISRNSRKELFPNGPQSDKNQIAAKNIKKELFPYLKSGTTPLHRRRNSIDAVNDTSDELATNMSSSINVPLMDGSNEFPLHSDILERKEEGLNIKGAAGLSIKGAANTEAKVKELFPAKVGNKGKELFGNRARKRADMFY
jgi:hypothetical protein